jgi:hypothetical protein
LQGQLLNILNASSEGISLTDRIAHRLKLKTKDQAAKVNRKPERIRLSERARMLKAAACPLKTVGFCTTKRLFSPCANTALTIDSPPTRVYSSAETPAPLEEDVSRSNPPACNPAMTPERPNAADASHPGLMIHPYFPIFSGSYILNGYGFRSVRVVGDSGALISSYVRRHHKSSIMKHKNGLKAHSAFSAMTPVGNHGFLQALSD